MIKQTTFSKPSKMLLGLSLALAITLICFLYQQGVWMEAVRYCRYFFQPKRLHTYLSSFGPYGVFVFIFLQFLQVVVAPIPGEVTGFIGGLVYGVLWGTVFSTIGLTMGSCLAFFLARTFGVGLVRKVVSKEFMEKFDRFSSSRKGFNVFFIFFLLPGVPKDSVCYLLGLSSMSYVDFLLINVFARLPSTVALTLQGHAVSRGHYGTFLVLFLVSLAVLGAFYTLRRFFLKSLPGMDGPKSKAETV